MTVNDSKECWLSDLCDNFFITKQDVEKKIKWADACKNKLQQLNYYVKVSVLANQLDSEEALVEAKLETYSVVVITDLGIKQQILINDYCRKHEVKFIAADALGVYGWVFNDFGDKFVVLDKDGEELQELVIDSITNAEEGIVTLQQGFKHRFEDGDEVTFKQIKGMKSLDDENKSLNDTVHKVKVINPASFKIGSTVSYSPYESSGLVKQIKSIKEMHFEPLSNVKSDEPPFDPNLFVHDFEKLDQIKWLH